MSGTAPPRHDRLVIAAGLLGLTALAWLYLWFDAGRMHPIDDGMAAMPSMAPMPSMEMASPWAWPVLALSVAMWAMMMVAMMLPSTLPAILLYAGLVRKHRAAGSVAPAAWIFAAGYLAVWTGFSLGAALLQAALQHAMLLSPMLASNDRWLTGGLLMLAGIYHWLPAKEACLQKCRAPLSFFMFRWRPGAAGAFRMGAEHGAYCLGCCWALMLLLFVFGVMNLVWIAVLAALVLAEKLLPAGRLVSRSAGVLLVLGGAVAIVGGS